MTDPSDIEALRRGFTFMLGSSVGGWPAPISDALKVLDRLAAAERPIAASKRKMLPHDSVIHELQAWADRGIGTDRQFEILYHGGIEHPWCVRLEDEPTSWSHEEDTCTFLGVAAAYAIEAAEKAGLR